jgi:hypothetical protein
MHEIRWSRSEANIFPDYWLVTSRHFGASGSPAVWCQANGRVINIKAFCCNPIGAMHFDTAHVVEPISTTWQPRAVMLETLQAARAMSPTLYARSTNHLPAVPRGPAWVRDAVGASQAPAVEAGPMATLVLLASTAPSAAALTTSAAFTNGQRGGR